MAKILVEIELEEYSKMIHNKVVMQGIADTARKLGKAHDPVKVGAEFYVNLVNIIEKELTDERSRI